MNVCILCKTLRYLTRVSQKVLSTSRSNPWDIRAFPFQYSEPMFFLILLETLSLMLMRQKFSKKLSFRQAAKIIIHFSGLYLVKKNIQHNAL